MASIQESVTKEVWDLFLKFVGTGSEFVYEIAHEGNVALKNGLDFTKELLIAQINKQKQLGVSTDAAAEMLKRVEKGERINTMPVADEDWVELNRYFQEKGILTNVVDDLSDDIKYFMYMSSDAEKVSEIVSLWQADKGLLSELRPELFLENYAKDGVGTLSGLDKVDLEVFREFAKKNGLVFASTATDDPDRYLVIYEPKNIDVVKKTMDSTVWALSGKDGRKLREDVHAYLLNRLAINRSLLEPEKEYYIVNGNDVENYVHLTANDSTYYKKSKEISSVDRSSAEFTERCLRVVNSLSQPVLLAREEFEKFNEKGELDKEEIKKIVDEKSKDCPKLDALKEAQKKQNERLQLIQDKMALDDESTAGFWIYDESVDYANGGEYEDMEDIDVQTKEDLAEARERAAQFRFLQVENNNLDYIIQKAKDRRPDSAKNGQEQKVEQVPETDYSH